MIEWLESPEGEDWSYKRHRFSRESSQPWIVIKVECEIKMWANWLEWEIEYAQGEPGIIPAKSGVAT